MLTEKTFLIIDDDRREVAPFIDVLQSHGHSVDYRSDPNQGIKAANHQYHMIFVDFKFPIADKDGTDVGMEIRKKCPLVPLVLFTANGKENIRDFIFVGFDDYFDKHPEGEKAREKKKRLFDCIENAVANFQRRTQTIFPAEELESIRCRLDNIEKAYSQSIAIDKTIQKIANEVSKIEGRGQQLKGQALSAMFQTAANGTLKTEALKARQLLIENPDKWPVTRDQFKPVKKLIEELIEYGFASK
jgi:CheY-like chemotaxis protein